MTTRIHPNQFHPDPPDPDHLIRESGPPQYAWEVPVIVAVWWVVFHLVMAFLTHLWTSRPYFEGRGGSLAEQTTWLVLFGAVSVGCLIAIQFAGWICPAAPVIRWASLGFMAVTVVAAVTFALNDGPHPGEWWCGPAGSTLGVLWAIARQSRRAH